MEEYYLLLNNVGNINDYIKIYAADKQSAYVIFKNCHSDNECYKPIIYSTEEFNNKNLMNSRCIEIINLNIKKIFNIKFNLKFDKDVLYIFESLFDDFGLDKNKISIKNNDVINQIGIDCNLPNWTNKIEYKNNSGREIQLFYIVKSIGCHVVPTEFVNLKIYNMFDFEVNQILEKLRLLEAKIQDVIIEELQGEI